MNHSFTTKELPESERPYEKFWKYGATALSDAELLAIVIKSGSSKMTAVDVARSFLSQKDRNLMNLYEMSYDEMKKIHGIGDVIAMQLKCIAELSTRIANTSRFFNLGQFSIQCLGIQNVIGVRVCKLLLL